MLTHLTNDGDFSQVYGASNSCYYERMCEIGTTWLANRARRKRARFDHDTYDHLIKMRDANASTYTHTHTQPNQTKPECGCVPKHVEHIRMSDQHDILGEQFTTI